MNNPFAFPQSLSVQAEPGAFTSVHAEHGMTLRDYFAAAALTGCLGESGCHLATERAKREGKRETEVMARIAYEVAEAMLKERENV